MKKKPYNDNLVMASIESLYNQANDSVSPADAGIKRQDPGKLPIVGSLPVTISDKTTDKTDDHLDDMVLTGLLDTVLVEQTAPAERTHGDDTSDNPFLAIRQAVISAGQSSSAQAIPEQLPESSPVTDKQSFAGQLADLIDAEIERRMTERLKTNPKPAAYKKQVKKQPAASAKPANKASKTKKPAQKRQSTKTITASTKKATKTRRKTKT